MKIRMWEGLARTFSFSKKDDSSAGFTLLEILLVIALIAILAAIVIIAINPARQVSQANNAQRRADVNTILNAVHQYGIDNDGVLTALSLPDDVATDCPSDTDHEVCKSGGTCTGLVDLETTLVSTYLAGIPTDPIGETANGAGYHVVVDTTGGTNRVTVCAPDAELTQTISVTR